MNGFIVSYVVRYVKNLIDSFKKMELKNWIASQLETTILWFYKASNIVPLSENDIQCFYQSWIYAEYVCDINSSDNGSFLTFNFPRLLLAELSILRKTRAIPSNTIINGYLLKMTFY